MCRQNSNFTKLAAQRLSFSNMLDGVASPLLYCNCHTSNRFIPSIYFSQPFHIFPAVGLIIKGAETGFFLLLCQLVIFISLSFTLSWPYPSKTWTYGLIWHSLLHTGTFYLHSYIYYLVSNGSWVATHSQLYGLFGHDQPTDFQIHPLGRISLLINHIPYQHGHLHFTTMGRSVRDDKF